MGLSDRPGTWAIETASLGSATATGRGQHVVNGRRREGERTGSLGLILELLEQAAEHGADLAVGEGGGLVEGRDGILKLCELLELERVDNGRDVLELLALGEQLLVLGLEEGIARAGHRVSSAFAVILKHQRAPRFGQDEKTHCGCGAARDAGARGVAAA
jgi:hypothetical protein